MRARGIELALNRCGSHAQWLARSEPQLAHQGSKAEDGTGQEPLQPGATATKAGGCKVGIRRTGRIVEITLASHTEYASIELYDSLVQAIKEGSLRLSLDIPRS